MPLLFLFFLAFLYQKDLIEQYISSFQTIFSFDFKIEITFLLFVVLRFLNDYYTIYKDIDFIIVKIGFGYTITWFIIVPCIQSSHVLSLRIATSSTSTRDFSITTLYLYKPKKPELSLLSKLSVYVKKCQSDTLRRRTTSFNLSSATE